MKKLLMLLSVITLGLTSCKKEEEKPIKVTYSVECKECFAHLQIPDDPNRNPFEPLTHVVGSWSKTVEHFPGRQHYMAVFINFDTGETQQVKASIKSDSNKSVSFDEIFEKSNFERSGRALTLEL